jgi:hypothetical protein
MWVLFVEVFVRGQGDVMLPLKYRDTGELVIFQSYRGARREGSERPLSVVAPLADWEDRHGREAVQESER